MAELETCRQAVNEMMNEAIKSSDGGVEGIAKTRLVEKVREIVKLKEERIDIIEGEAEYSRDRLMEIADRQDELMRELKTHGMPYHPVMGNKSDWEGIEV